MVEKPFWEYAATDAKAALAEITAPAQAVNAAYYAGDHWQGGAAYVGPRPDPSEADAAKVLRDIERAYVSKNAIREVALRVARAVAGREARWALTPRRPLEDKERPTAEEQVLIDEAGALLTAWWDKRRVHWLVLGAAATMQFAGRASLRAFIPRGLLELRPDGATGVPAGDVAQQLDRIYVMAPAPAQGGVIVDDLTQQRCGVYVYVDEDGKEWCELCYLDPLGATVVKVLGGQVPLISQPLAMGGRLTMAQGALDAPLISPQVRSLQNLLNLALTMMQRNAVLGGFLERVIFDAQLPGHYDEVVQSNGQKVKRFVPDAEFKVGAGTVNTLVSAHYVDPKTGEPKQIGGSPSISYHDPVPVATFSDTKDEAYTAILEECHQLHAKISGDASASGESRKQARADFEASLGETKAAVEGMLRDLLEGVLAMAAALAGQPGHFEALRAVVECRVDSGPVSADEMQLAQQLAGGKPLWSVERAQGATGVDDPDAEQQQMASEAMASAAATTAPRTPAAAGADGQQQTTTPQGGQETTNGQ